MYKNFKVSVLNTPISALSMVTIENILLGWGRIRESRFIVFSNVHVVVNAYQDSKFADVISAADIVAPDGAPIAWMINRLSGRRQERVSGPDLMWSLLAHCEKEKLAVYFYGSTLDTLALLEVRVKNVFPNLRICGVESPPFRMLTDAEEIDSVRKINLAEPAFVFVGLGCPKQEKWMLKNRGKIDAVMLGVGAAFDFHAGTVLRAPLWMREYGLEWLHRLASEPRRLWRRYFVTNSLFVLLAARQLLLRKLG